MFVGISTSHHALGIVRLNLQAVSVSKIGHVVAQRWMLQNP